jgi:hypothetical protein
VTRPAERSLDDAFRILARQNRKGKTQAKKAQKATDTPAVEDEPEEAQD